MLTIWGRKSSSNVQAVMWAVAELDLEHIRHDAGYLYGVVDSDAFFALNPNRTIPVIEDDAIDPLWEAGAILRYLGRTYGAQSLWPADTRLQTEVDKWAEWAKLNVAMAFTVPVFWRAVRTAPKDRDAAAIVDAMAALCDKLAIAETQLAKQPYLASDRLSLADIQLGHILFRYFDIDVARPDFPNIEAYYKRLTKRRAFQDHVMISYEELRVR